MKWFIYLCTITILLNPTSSILQKQVITPTPTVLGVGDIVLVMVDQLPMYATASDSGPIVFELVKGYSSRLLKTQTDSNGKKWLYLSDNLHGWVPAEVNKQPSIVIRNDNQTQSLIDGATKVLSENPQSAAYLTRALAYMVRRDYKDAATDFTTAIQQWPDDAQLYLYRTFLDADNYDYQQQNLDAAKATVLNRRLPFAYIRWGLALNNLGQISASEKAFTAAIQQTPDYAVPYYGLSSLYDHYTQYDQALANANDAIQRDPLFGFAVSLRGFIYQHESQYDKAAQDFNQSIVVDPYCSACYINRGQFLGQFQGDEQGALADFNKAIEVDPFNADAYANRGISNARASLYDKAIADLEYATQLAPKSFYAFFSLGGVYAEVGQYAQSINAYTTAIPLGSGYPSSVLIYRAQVYLAVGNYEAALNDLNILIANSDTEYFHTVALLLRGEIYLYLHRFDLALRDYSAVVSNAAVAGFVKDYNNQGRGFWITLPRQGELNQLEQMSKANPSDASSLYALATLQMEFGLWSQANVTYQSYFTLTKTPIPSSLAQLLQLLTN